MSNSHGSFLLPESVRRCDIDEVLVVKFVVFSEVVHVGCDLRRSCSLHNKSEVWRKCGLVTGVVQH